MQLEHILSVQNRLGEGPIWIAEEQTLYWTDILGECFHTYHPASGKHEVIQVGVKITVIAIRESGGLLFGTNKGLAFWDQNEKKLNFFVNPEANKPENRFNDGAVDRMGRFWVGSMRDDEKSDGGSLYRVEPDGSFKTMIDGLTISNGLGWSLDDKMMYVTDTPHCIYVYDYDAPSGTIANRRLFSTNGQSDGLVVDSEGFVWSARWGGWKVVRYDPQGKVDREITLPVECITCLAFGGPNLDDIYITTANKSLSAEEKKQQPLAGDLFRINMGIKGQLEPRFKG